MIDSAVRTARTRRRWPNLIAGWLGLACAAAAAVGVLVHFLGPVSTTVTLLASFSPLAILGALLAVALLVAARWWVAAAMAAVVAAAGVSAQLPLYLGAPASVASEAPTITLLQANIRLGEADADALVERVRRNQVDVLTVSELTEEAVGRLAAAGIAELLPFAHLEPKMGGSGAGIYARHPLTEPTVLPELVHNNLRAVMTVPGAEPVAVYALHPVPPYPEPAWRWATDLERIGAVFAAESRPLIVGADFNSTYDHRRYRDLVSAGTTADGELLDAAEHLGAGIVATYPADRWYPPALAIDRILTRGATPLTFVRVDLPGSDHHGVLAEVRLEPRGD